MEKYSKERLLKNLRVDNMIITQFRRIFITQVNSAIKTYRAVITDNYKTVRAHQFCEIRTFTEESIIKLVDEFPFTTTQDVSRIEYFFEEIIGRFKGQIAPQATIDNSSTRLRTVWAEIRNFRLRSNFFPNTDFQVVINDTDFGYLNELSVIQRYRYAVNYLITEGRTHPRLVITENYRIYNLDFLQEPPKDGLAHFDLDYSVEGRQYWEHILVNLTSSELPMVDLSAKDLISGPMIDIDVIQEMSTHDFFEKQKFLTWQAELEDMKIQDYHKLFSNSESKVEFKSSKKRRSKMSINLKRK